MSVFLNSDGGTQIALQSGVLFDPLSPDPDLITIEDVAYGLAGQFRFAGHTRLTVAQHSVVASLEVDKRYALDALFHDASEGLGLLDFSRPLKHHLLGEVYRVAEFHLMSVLAYKFGFHWPVPEAVKQIDDALCITEARDLLGRIPLTGEPVLERKIVCWPPSGAEKIFLYRYRELTK